MESKNIIRILNLVYFVWFIISFSSYVALKPLTLTEEITTVPLFLSSIYNFCSLAIIGLLLTLVTPEKERLIPALLALISGLSNLITGIVLLAEGKINVASLNAVIVGSSTFTAGLYVVIVELRKIRK
jgi:hypothetical protein